MTAPFFPPAQAADASAVRPPNTPPYRTPPSLTPGNSYGTPPEPPPSVWQRIQHLPLIGRDAADAFRGDIGQAWQGIKERLAGYKMPTAIPYAGLALGAANAMVPETDELGLLRHVPDELLEHVLPEERMILKNLPARIEPLMEAEPWKPEPFVRGRRVPLAEGGTDLPAGAPRELGGAPQSGVDFLGMNERGRIGPLYHGSPHDFDQFDISKVGTGEGAAAYGHGLYFASEKEVGEFYRNQLAGQPEINHLRLGSLDVGPHNNFDYNPKGNSLEENIRSSLAENLLIDQQALTAAGPKGVQQHVLKELDATIEQYKREWPEGVAPAQRLRAKLARPGAVSLDLTEHPGKLYTVDADVNPEHLLDWDKPLHEQSEHVQTTLKQLAADNPMFASAMKNNKTLTPETFPARMAVGQGAAVVKEESELGPHFFMETGGKRFRLSWEDVQRSVGDWHSGSGAYSELSRQLGGDEAASAALREKGIMGIRYRDAGSRDATATKQASHNYVIFHHAPIKITDKGGATAAMLAGTGAAAGAALTAAVRQKK
jgi:hypothetical protein